jgi:deazaflavin-dependent oxidoreductase (nitroreductase family)
MGIPMGPLYLLSHQGRKSGKIYSTPVAIVERDGVRWLVAAFGEVNWVHNIRAAGSAILKHGRTTERIRFDELEPAAAAPVLQQFLKSFGLVPFIPPYFNVTPKSSIEEWEREALHHPVFQITANKAEQTK